MGMIAGRGLDVPDPIPKASPGALLHAVAVLDQAHAQACQPTAAGGHEGLDGHRTRPPCSTSTSQVARHIA